LAAKFQTLQPSSNLAAKFKLGSKGANLKNLVTEINREYFDTCNILQM
jgi:hypothetical protein